MDTAFSKFTVFYYGYDEIETFCLSKREQLAREGIGLILGVLRGGGIPALMLSQMLCVPVDFIHYDRRTAKAEIKNPEALDLIDSCINEGKKILLVEDMAGVGYTLVNAWNYLRSLVRDERLIKVFVLIRHENSRMTTDYGRDCSDFRAILPWERYVTGQQFFDDYVAVGQALIGDQIYKKTVAIHDRANPLVLKPEWKIDHHVEYDGDRDSTVDTIETIGPEEIYCNNESLISLIVKKFSFAIVYKVIDEERMRILSLG